MAHASVREAVERSVRRGAAVALVMAEVHTGANLTDVEGFSAGESLVDYAFLLP